MKIEEFVGDYKIASDKAKYCAKRVVNKYVTYENKIAQCEAIVNNTTHVKAGDMEFYTKNTPGQYLMFTLTLINLYTDIEIDFSNSLASFNALDEIGAIDTLMSVIPESEYTKFNTILQMIIDDHYENERSLVGYIDNKFRALEVVFGSLLTEENKAAINNALTGALSQ